MNKVKKVLIFRQGSLGDTIVALPCFHAIAKAFPQAERCVLTNLPVNAKACAIAHVLDNSGLVNFYMDYPVNLNIFRKFFILRKQIKKYCPDIIVYLIELPKKNKVWRDYIFFKLLGIKQIIGMPLSNELNQRLFLQKEKKYEYEGARLARSLEKDLGKIDLNDPANWELFLTQAEHAAVSPYIQEISGNFFVCSIGTKWPENDWGQKNWTQLLQRLSEIYPDYGLIITGVKNEYERSQDLLSKWQGPKINLCGQLSVRETAALLQHAKLFLGHDSGPMHLAATQNIPCVAIFSRRNPPGIWFPFGKQHEVIYPEGETIESISIDQVLAHVCKIIAC